ncbi:MAG: esterase-like activity of phytase family protein, partial [Cyanothece sp. SIO1E1]|nr:esterase-like activity of phytase family protein [Cyanothece sp. SIO1E1]
MAGSNDFATNHPNHSGRGISFWQAWSILTLLIMTLLLTGCDLPQVSAQERIFLHLSLEFLGEYQLPTTTLNGTTVGGLSAIAYDRQRNLFYALSDDRSKFSPARFYTLQLCIDTSDPDAIDIAGVTIENETVLKGEDGAPYATGTIDPEGMALSPRQTVFISSEGVSRKGIAPFVNEFDLQTGEWRQSIPLPNRYL